MNYCQVSGCARGTKGYARFCNSHRARNRRHGSPTQTTITTARLRPYAQEIERYVERVGGERLWADLETLWGGAVAKARDVLADYHAGRPSFRPEIAAAADIVSGADEAEARRVIATVGGMVLMREQDARAFRSDRAFWVQVARRFRALGTRHVGTYTGRGGRTHRVYRDANADAAVVLGRWLVTALGLVGDGAQRAEMKERARLNEARAAVYAAMSHA